MNRLNVTVTLIWHSYEWKRFQVMEAGSEKFQDKRASMGLYQKSSINNIDFKYSYRQNELYQETSPQHAGRVAGAIIL